MHSVAYSPDGHRIISGSYDTTIRIWDVETGAAVGNPLKGYTSLVLSIAYSPDGRLIVSGSHDCTIRIWDAETGAAIRKPLNGHTSDVCSVAYSPDGRHIASGSFNKTIRIWDADWVRPVVYSSDGQHIASGACDQTTCVGDSYPNVPNQPSSCSQIHSALRAMPGVDSWVRDAEGGLLYWVPHDCRESVHSPAIMTMPLSSPNRSVSLDFNDFVFGTSWAQILKNAAL